MSFGHFLILTINEAHIHLP